MSETPVEPPVEEVPVEEVPVEEIPRQVQETTSIYFKISRAIDGSNFWIARLEMAFEVNAIENNRANLVAVTKKVVDLIDCTEDGAVFTDRVTDEAIDAAIESL